MASASGLINLLIYLIVGVFIAGLMVGRTPEYLGKKVEAKEMKLASLAMLAHPLLILIPAGLFVATDWGFSTRIIQQLTAFPKSFMNSLQPPPTTALASKDWATPLVSQRTMPHQSSRSEHWDIACGLVMLFSRFIPIIAPIAIAGSLAVKKATPMTVGTLRTDTITFGFVLLGTIILVGALLFLPAAVLGPVAEHLGPLPFGG